jgi:hypothetical protein
VYNENGKAIVCMFRQFDGYIDGHGQELADLLKGKKEVNGYGMDTTDQFNGMGCLAATIVAHFKDGIGGFYLQDPDLGDEEFNYRVYSGGVGKEPLIAVEFYDEFVPKTPASDFVDACTVAVAASEEE